MRKIDLLKLLNKNIKNTLIETLSIEFTEIGDDYLLARMPVNQKVHQPDGVLHGGATAALAETVGSAASSILAKGGKSIIRGIELSINHLKSITTGYVYAKAISMHNGKTMQLWEIKITNENGKIISLAKLTTLTLQTN